MKVSQKRNRWVYIGLILMLGALVCFSMAPLLSSIVQSSASKSVKSPLTAFNKLESQVLGYQMVLEREPENQNALSGLLEAKLRQGDIQGAIAPLEKLAQLNPQQPDYAYLLAQTKQQVQDYQGAKEIYQTLLASAPDNMQALKGLVDLLMAQDQPTEAIDLVQTTITKAINAKAQSPDSSTDLTSLQLLLGEIYLQQKQYTEALAIYDQAIKSDAQDFRPVLAKALIFREQGKNTESETLFKEAINLAPVYYKDSIKEIAAQKPEKSASSPGGGDNLTAEN